MNVMKIKGVVISLMALMTIMTGCVNTRNATSFADITDKSTSANTPVPESFIQKNDLLSITVSSLNPEASAVFNSPNVTSPTISGTNSVTGYLVSSDGNIQFPILGNIKAAGLSKDQLKETINNKLLERKLLIDPIVSVRFLNFRVTILGEVAHPLVVNVPNEKISLLEALGMAGDLTVYARRDNVLIIREENGDKTFKRLNLTSSELLSSPYYYLKSNDIIYVEPNKSRIAATSRSQQWIPVVLSSLSLVVIVLDRVLNNK
jgi:polysaccharide export outer membrane protein